jgi:two-component sensor histidine kinase/CheY-like chemotaxis protein
VLRAKVRVFVDLYIKTRQLERVNDELERRVADRTVQLEAAIARQELLAREVDHRARNALAVIQSIISLTPPDNSEHFAAAVKGRIRAMATAHNLLSESRWVGADLLGLMHEELAPYELEGRVTIKGDAVSILPTVAQSLALALHELATNAAKYGALSQREGKLSVSWRHVEDALQIEWIEQCASPIGEPGKRGFGSKVIEASIKAQLGGRVDREWRSTGLHCVFRLPSSHFTAPEAANEVAAGGDKRSDADLSRVRDRRVLILEDEPLIAMMTARLIREFGAAVIGPFPNTREAAEALNSGVDVALLDVNIAGEFVYPLADALAARDVPIVFVTGYQAGAIEPRFARVPVLTKPIEREDLAIALTHVLAPAAEDKVRA